MNYLFLSPPNIISSNGKNIITLRSKFWSQEGYGTIKYIYNVHYIVKRICFQYEAAFVFWIKGLTFIILNISGVIITDNLRAILLFEADLNFSNKLYFWIRLMKRAQSSGVISGWYQNYDFWDQKYIRD